MEGKDRWEQKGRIFLPSPSSFTLLYLSLSTQPIAYHQDTCLRPTTPSGAPTTQDPVFARTEQYSTGRSDPHGTNQWDGRVYTQL